jgi:hypothetical protein
VDDGGPAGGIERIAIIDRSGAPDKRKVVSTFFTHGREAHGLWTNPAGNLLYVAHEQDELPGTANEGQTVCAAFDVTDPFKPSFIAQIPLGVLKLPSGELRNKKSINLVYVRPGARGRRGNMARKPQNRADLRIPKGAFHDTSSMRYPDCMRPCALTRFCNTRLCAGASLREGRDSKCVRQSHA